LREPKPQRGREEERAEAAENAQKARRENPLVLLARYSEIGFLIPAAVVVGYLFGLLADHLLHTHWLYLVGILFGAVAGFVSMIRRALQSGEEAAAEDQAAAEQGAAPDGSTGSQLPPREDAASGDGKEEDRTDDER
jgi:F0F1-type ATP synthase assembly protein I